MTIRGFIQWLQAVLLSMSVVFIGVANSVPRQPGSDVGPPDHHSPPARKRALVRIEGVGPDANAAQPRAIVDYLADHRVPFSIDILGTASRVAVVRDGVASFAYHPYPGTSHLGEVVAGIRAMGSTFVTPAELGCC